MRKPIVLVACVVLGGCSIQDSITAREAQTKLVGMKEVDLDSCLGSPDQHTTFGNTDVLTWYANSTSSSSASIPIVGGISFSNGGYCHLTARVVDGQVQSIRYTGENNAFAAPFAYCAPIVRSCVRTPEPLPPPAATKPPPS